MRERPSKKKNSHIKRAKTQEADFYVSVYAYLMSEYSPKIVSLFNNSPISKKIVHLVSQYYWGGNSVPNTAGDIADLIRSKYKTDNRERGEE